MEAASRYAALFKINALAKRSQSERRQELLEKQKEQRLQAQDNLRPIKEFIAKIHKAFRYKTYEEKYKNERKLQLSEWLREKPEDLSRWMLVPCPEGKRCMIVANGKRTEFYSKTGRLQRTFRSVLPGDAQNQNSITILDCIYVEKNETFYILDVLAYNNHDLVHCDVEFRVFWLQSRISEISIGYKHNSNDHPFILLHYCDFEDEDLINDCLTKYPFWDNNCPKLDGLLFYHKEASYVYGQTPLVGWLFPFLVPEVLQLEVHPQYMDAKPDDFENHQAYMDEFDKKLAKQHSSYTPNKETKKLVEDTMKDIDNDNMESADMFTQEDDEECDMTLDIPISEKYLEIFGLKADDNNLD